jgi:hypothetical protein
MSPATDCEEHGKQGGFKRLAQVIPTREVTALVNDRSRRMSERPVCPDCVYLSDRAIGCQALLRPDIPIGSNLSLPGLKRVIDVDS